MEERQKIPFDPETTSRIPSGWPRRHILRAFIPLLLVVIVIILGFIFAKPRNSGSGISGDPHLLIDNKTQNKINVVDKSHKTQYSLNYPDNSYVSFEASSASGQLLFSYPLTANHYEYIFAAGNKNLPIAKASAKELDSAIYLNGSHQLFFLSDNNVVYVSCPSGKTCLLKALNLLTGQSKTVADTGAKPVIAALPPVYPLGVGRDGKSIFLRTLETNKLGKNVGGVYEVDQNGKVSASWQLDITADYTPKLSPDSKQIVYKTGFKDQTTISTLDLSVKKTHKTSWKDGELADTASTFSWSPDSKRVFFSGSDAILPRPKPDATFATHLAYLQVDNSQITNLQTIQDSAHNQIAYHGWLDNQNVIYEQDTTKEAYVFSSSSVTPAIFKQNIKSKTASKDTNLSGSLKSLVFY